MIKWLRSRLAEPASGSSVVGSAVTQANRCAFMLGIGLLLGTAVAVGGGILGGLIDTGPRRFGAAAYGPILVLVPAIGYGVAIALLRVGRGRLSGPANITSQQLVRGRKTLSTARGVIIAGLIPNAFLALFGGLALIGPADAFDSGAAISGAVGIGAEWVILIPAIVALVWASAAVKLTPALISNDGLWWWDGLTWRPVPVGPVQSAQAIEVRASDEAPVDGPYRAGVVAYGAKTNVLAVVSAAAGILSWTVCPFVAAIAAVAAGHIALRQARKLHQLGRRWAFAGIILGYLNLVLFGGLGILVLLTTTGHAAAAVGA